jgi:heptosyltransferase-1
MKILIIRVSAIGDVIHTLPAIFFIKQCCFDAQISWVVQKKAASLIATQPFLENVFILDDKFLHLKNIFSTIKTIKELRRTKWDAILDFQGLPKTSILLAFLSGLKFGFASPHARSWVSTLFTSVKAKPDYKNIIQKNLCLASEFVQGSLPKLKNPLKWFDKLTTSGFFKPRVVKGLTERAYECPTIDTLKKSFALNIPEPNKEAVDKWLLENNIKRFILLCPNTTWETKHWPQENWLEFIKLFTETEKSYDLLLVGQNFGEAAKNIASKIKANNLSVTIVPDINLCEAAHLISKASLVIAPDTGLLHLADFLNIQSIGIFGPTSKDLLGGFLCDENKKNAIQVYWPERWNLKKTTKSHNQMYKLSSRMMLEKVLAILKRS